MRTKKWIHYKGFTDNLKIAEHLYLLDTKLNHDPPSGKKEILSTEALRGGAAVLCVATLEAFLKKITEGYVSEFTTTAVRFELLPDKIKLMSVFGTLDYCFKPPKSSTLNPERLLRIGDVMAMMSGVGAGRVEPQVFSNTNSNPSPEQIKKMLSDIGITDFFRQTKAYFESEWGSPVSGDFIKDKLDEIVNRRHVVAHTASALSISRAQLKESFKFLKVLARCIEHSMFNQTRMILRTCK